MAGDLGSGVGNGGERGTRLDARCGLGVTRGPGVERGLGVRWWAELGARCCRGVFVEVACAGPGLRMSLSGRSVPSHVYDQAS